METLFLHYVETYRLVSYAIIFLSLLLEGELVIFAAVFLASQGYLRFSELVPVAFVGIVLGDYLWYLLGRRITNKQNRISAFANRASKLFGKATTERPLRLLLTTKFIYGLHRPTLIAFGVHKLPAKRFIGNDAIAASVWLLVVGGIAFAASESFYLARHYLKYAEVSLLVAVVAWYIFTRIAAILAGGKNPDAAAEEDEQEIKSG